MVETTVGVCATAVALAAIAQYRMFLRSVERYRAQVGDHDKVLEYAAAIRPALPLPQRRPPA